MRAHLIIDLTSGAIELHTDTAPKLAKAVRGADRKPRKRGKGKARHPAKAVKVGTNVTTIKKGA